MPYRQQGKVLGRQHFRSQQLQNALRLGELGSSRGLQVLLLSWIFPNSRTRRDD